MTLTMAMTITFTCTISGTDTITVSCGASQNGNTRGDKVKLGAVKAFCSFPPQGLRRGQFNHMFQRIFLDIQYLRLKPWAPSMGPLNLGSLYAYYIPTLYP